MTDTAGKKETKEQPVRPYVVTDAGGNEVLREAASPVKAVEQVYEHKVRLATFADIKRLMHTLPDPAKPISPPAPNAGAAPRPPRNTTP